MKSAEILAGISSQEVIPSDHSPGSSLIVFVHGWTTKAERFAALIEAMAGDPAFHASDFLAIDFSAQAGRFSNADPVRIAHYIRERIRIEIQLRDYPKVILCGWSMGGVLVREAILQDIEDPSVHRFHDRIDRLVLLASTNRGFIPSGWWQKTVTPLIRCLPICGLIKSVLHESSFILNLRMRWIRTFEGDGSLRPPDTVQVLGSLDTIVSPEDSADIYRYANSASREIPARGHFDLVDVEGHETLHYKLLREAFVEELQHLNQPKPSSPEHFVFLVHGIRDFGGWTRDIATSLVELHGKPDELIPYPFRYGYFNILNFLLPFVRRRQARRFVDRYANALARHPNSSFHFVGHSNGTFLLGEALRAFPGVRFDSVFLAGSVLSEHYDWIEVFEKGRVRRLRNDCASGDIPVGFLCAFLRTFFRDLGVGGFRGFQRLPPTGFHENQWLKGDHGAALKGQARTGDIARWVLEGRTDATDPMTRKPGPLLELLSRFALPVGLIVLIILGMSGSYLLHHNLTGFIAFIIGLTFLLLYV